jgi:hypothetical protein
VHCGKLAAVVAKSEDVPASVKDVRFKSLLEKLRKRRIVLHTSVIFGSMCAVLAATSPG